MTRFGGNRPAGGAPGPKKGRFAGVPAADNRYPMPAAGRYRLRILETYLSFNGGTKREWYHADFEVVTSSNDKHSPGDKVSMLQGISGASEDVGLPKIKRFVMASVKCDDVQEFEANDGNELCDTTMGEASEQFKPNPLAGRLVDADVGLGAMTKDGSDHYRNWSFSIVEDQPDFGE